MKFYLPYCSVLLLLLLNAFVASGQWTILKKNSFQVAFPGQPRADTFSEKSKMVKVWADTYTYQNAEDETDSNSVYQLIVTTYSEKLPETSDMLSVKKLFDEGQKKGVEEAAGKLISQKDIRLGKYAGREVKLSVEEGQGIIITRLILVNQKIFILLIAADARKENNTKATRFFDSFTVQ